MSNQPNIPLRFLITTEAARFVGLSARTLEKHRIYGTGPAFCKLGGRVVYAIADLQAWVLKGRRQSTFELASDIVHPAKRQPQDSSEQIQDPLETP